MMSRIYCTNPQHGELHFYLLHRGKPYYLFCQPYRRQVYQFYARPMLLDDALSYAKAKGRVFGMQLKTQLYKALSYNTVAQRKIYFCGRKAHEIF